MKKNVYITTKAHLEWDEEKRQYIAITDEGYWYSGPLALATTPPVLEVTDWAFFDDGTESGSSIIGTKNTNPTLDVDTLYQFRTGLEETGGNLGKNQTPQLQYNHNAGGWNNVTGSSLVIQAVASANLTDGGDTTQRLTAFTYDSSNEGIDEVDGLAGGATADLISNGFEALFSFQIIGADVANNDTIQLKIVNGADADADYTTYNQTDATITANVGVVDHVATGALLAQSATIAGTALRDQTHDATGTLLAQSAVIAGTADRATVHEATGALTAQDAVIAGTALRDQTHDATGALDAQSAVIAGTAARVGAPIDHVATGDLTADPAVIAGTALRDQTHDATGALTAQSATITGTAARSTPGGFVSAWANGANQIL